MKAAEPKKKTERRAATEHQRAGKNENDESKNLNRHRSSGAFAEAPAIVKAAPPASPLRFYARLRHELESRGIDYDGLPRLTPEGRAPPCFTEFGVSFRDWLGAASLLGATVPYRSDMPAEPNYCWDCTACFKGAAKKVGACRFPGTQFARAHTIIADSAGRTTEIEVVGVSRSPTQAVDAALLDEYTPRHKE